ncbi:unnamed protein product [Owenia fusiformis]|uniref:Multiple epidermal growth factor-like domains protein 8 n=1 Tax=Owenia fusiformis TaxID=6347 RepID=A0A8S4NU91_OWEFU|nr:unnamed protein product [Owenia fusiformis]
MELRISWSRRIAIIYTLCITVLSILLVPECIACNGKTDGFRQVLNSTTGIISDGKGDYPISAHCEWLIQAGSPDKFITLKFENLSVECSYDYIFIYDGESYNSKLLGSFSGSNTPPLITATSGNMLIYFYSDRNYALEGFNATYTVTDCLLDCSGKGTCNSLTHTCHCHPGMTGDGCQLQECPDFCSQPLGECIGGKCVCIDGFTGSNCALSMNSTIGNSSWYQVAPAGSGFTARTGHAGAFISSSNSFWLFGGNTLNEILNDLIRYDFPSNKWIEVTKSGTWPEARNNHAAAATQSGLFIFGGIAANGTHLSDLWFYDITSGVWIEKALAGTVHPPGLSGHTLTLVTDGNSQYLYLLGGRDTYGAYQSALYCYDILGTTDTWIYLTPKGGKEELRRLVGHSTVYHPESKSLLVYGGFTPDYARFSKRSKQIHSYHIELNYWSHLDAEPPSHLHYNSYSFIEPPNDRAFHSANIIGNYMVVYGGNCHIHQHEEICYDNKLYLYHLGCHVWINHTALELPWTGGVASSGFVGGRYSHVASVAFGNTLLISGGYQGTALGDLIAYKVPPSMARNQNDDSIKDHCSEITDGNYCRFDPECALCTSKKLNYMPGCIHRSKTGDCKGIMDTSECPGICPTLKDCQSCAVQGKGYTVTMETTKHGLKYNDQCAWCVKEATCQLSNVTRGACNHTDGTRSGLTGWWGIMSHRPTTLEMCRLQDKPAGLHFLKYLPPQNLEQPDEVIIIRNTTAQFIAFGRRQLMEIEQTLKPGKYIGLMKGFIYPLEAEIPSRDPIQVTMVAKNAQSDVYLSLDDTKARKEKVASLAYSNVQSEISAVRPSGEAIFPVNDRSSRYYVEYTAELEIFDDVKKASMQLVWNGAIPDTSTSMLRQPFFNEFLEPYTDTASNANCSNLGNCLACLSDTVCGWCKNKGKCVMRNDVDNAGCATTSATELVITPADCTVCGDHLSCHICAADSLCEWLPNDGRCMRRGRYVNAIQSVGQCAAACHLRSNCSTCIGDRGECAWCGSTSTCFPFSDYITRHNFGQCTEWFDSKSQNCSDCSQHTTCKSCLKEFQCGWCGNTDNPTIGRCLSGDFTGPSENNNCSALVAEVNNITASEPAAWAYGICPDVQECTLGVHDCHENATCINTFESYNCTCKQGFVGDGKERCDVTCFHDCVFGTCSEAPDYKCICDRGWTGEGCDINCQCNNRSTCVYGVGQCDNCEDWTMGTHCQECRPGSYGNAKTSEGCKQCECNGHADNGLDTCNMSTGQCYCRDNTHGDHCELCQENYYGDPRNNGRCYLKCDGRTVVTDVVEGALGSHDGSGVADPLHAYCVWFLLFSIMVRYLL